MVIVVSAAKAGAPINAVPLNAANTKVRMLLLNMTLSYIAEWTSAFPT
jgi:hypothetical protein